jgi:hypothetical protein
MGLEPARSSSLEQVPAGADAEPDTNGDPGVPDLTLGQKVLLRLPDLKRRPAGVSANPRTQPRSDPKTAQVEDPGEVEEESESDPSSSSEDPSRRTSSTSQDKPVARSTKAGASAGRTAAGRARPSPYDDMPTPELTQLMKRLDDRERLLTTIAAPLGAVLSVLETLLNLHNDPKSIHAKNYISHGTLVTDGILALVLCVFILVMARMRKRSLSAFGLMILGVMIDPLGIGLPFLVFGGYLVFKMLKVQKVLTARGVTRPTASRRAATRSTSAPSSKSAKGSRADAPSKSGAAPTPSKRYTPPKPAPKRPAPAPEDEKSKRPNWLERATERAEQRAATRAEKTGRS